MRHVARRIYSSLLLLYPVDYRSAFAGEMLLAFDQAAAHRRYAAEFLGLIAGAASEWFAKITTDRSIRGRCLPDPRMMRPPGVPREIWFMHVPPCSSDTTR